MQKIKSHTRSAETVLISEESVVGVLKELSGRSGVVGVEIMKPMRQACQLSPQVAHLFVMKKVKAFVKEQVGGGGGGDL